MTNDDSNPSILDSVSEYYSERIEKFGVGPKGVDWNGLDSQVLRFEQLARLLPTTDPFSLDDYGCGYGALREYLHTRGYLADYRGLDISEAMIREAKRLHGDCFAVSSRSNRMADYAVASGIFNVKLNASSADWLNYILTTVEQMHQSSRCGIAFNCLTKYSDRDRMVEKLYYADPGLLFDHCKRHLSRNVALLHDYGLYEFTIIVRAN